jgi:hypothetical protein
MITRIGPPVAQEFSEAREGKALATVASKTREAARTKGKLGEGDG